MVDVSIIIPTINRNESLNLCINSIIDCCLPNIEIIIVNDNKDSVIHLNQNNDSIKILNNPKKGVASARNFGAQHANAPILLFVDDDMILNKEAIVAATNYINKNSNSVYNANWVYPEKLIHQISKTQFGRYLIQHNFTTLKGWNNGQIAWQENALVKANSVTSQFLAIHKKDFFDIGCYNENFPHAGFEDHDFAKKINNNNFNIVIDTNILIFHNEIDRLNHNSWLQRKQRGAYTRKIGVELGFNELKINYSKVKVLFYTLITNTEFVINIILKIIPNIKLFDYIYFKLINLLLGAYLFKGYYFKYIK